jgi:hypothetical protein
MVDGFISRDDAIGKALTMLAHTADVSIEHGPSVKDRTRL